MDYRVSFLQRGDSPMKIGTGTFVAVAASLTLLIAGTGVGITAHVGSHACERQAARLGTAYTWDLGVGCYIETEPGRWVSAKNL